MEHAALTRYVLEGQSRPDWEDRLRTGEWYSSASAEGLTPESFRKFDSRVGSLQASPASVVWALVEQHRADYGVLPTIWEVEQFVRESLARRDVEEGQAQEILSFLAEVSAATPRPESWEFHLSRALEDAKRVYLSWQVYQAAKLLATDVSAAADLLRSIKPVSRTPEVVAFTELVGNRWEEYQHAREGLGRGVLTGFRGWDTQVGTVQGGELVLVIARTTIGKSWIMTEAARNGCLLRGRMALFYCGEMTSRGYMSRIEGVTLGVDPARIRNGFLGDREQEYRQLLWSWASGLNGGEILWVDRQPGMRVGKLRDVLLRAQDHRQRKVDALFVDPMYKLLPTRDRGGSALHEDMTSVAVDLKGLAMGEDIPLFTTHQKNREGTKNPGDLGASMRYSDSIADEADQVLELTREADGSIKVTNRKAREGHDGWEFKIALDLKRGMIAEIANAPAAPAVSGPTGPGAALPAIAGPTHA